MSAIRDTIRDRKLLKNRLLSYNTAYLLTETGELYNFKGARIGEEKM
jgi:hypothetical protein